MTYSLHRPPAGLTGFRCLIWPLIYLQLVALRAWVRKHYGPGVPFWFEFSPWGKVHLLHLPIDFAQSYAAPGALKPAAFDFTLAITSPRLAGALAGEAAEPMLSARLIWRNALQHIPTSRPRALGRGVGVRGSNASARAPPAGEAGTLTLQ